MERTMSVEDKIRRAEEIYYRRKEGNSRASLESKPKRKNIKLFRKMIKQIIVCLIIYAIFYMVINNNYVFSEDFTNKAKEILSQDINFCELYKIFLDKFQNVNIPNESSQENTTDIQNNNENIGGAEEKTLNIEENIEEKEIEEDIPIEEPAQLSQMEKDINYIKSITSFIKPVEGKISSRYGPRNPTTSTVPKNHTGTDIAATKGTKIVSATSGNVIYAASKGDFGKHIKIQVNDLTIIYAHCNKLYVKKGDVIAQGQEIGEVGATGNTTGPHLHFEIRYQDRTVDPEMILDL